MLSAKIWVLYPKNAFSSEKVIWSKSGEKYAQIKHCLCANTLQNSSKQICQQMLLWVDNRGWAFSLDEAFLARIDGFVSYKHFSLPKMLIDGMERCGLLWCFYQLFGLSFWRHPFTAEDPLVTKWFYATFLQICFWWRNKLMFILDGLRVSTFSATFNFWVNYLLYSKTLVFTLEVSSNLYMSISNSDVCLSKHR